MPSMIRPRLAAPSDILSAFTEDVARIDMLPPDKERVLGLLARDGNMEAYHAVEETLELIARMESLEQGALPTDTRLDPNLCKVTYKVMRDNRTVEETTSFASSRSGKTKLTAEGQAVLEAVRAQQELVKANLRFVITVAKKYDRRGVPLPDLIQAGNIGLMHAAEKFDPDFGVRFITYAVWWIRQQIKRELDMHNGTMRESQTQLGRIRKVRKVIDDLKRMTGREPSVDEIKLHTGFTVERINDAIEYRVSFSSLDEPVNSADGSGATLGQMIGDEDDGEERETSANQKEFIARFLSVLSPREREILSESYGLDERRDLSLADIGEARGITRERARQIRQRALEKLKKISPEFAAEVASLWTTNKDMLERQERGTEQLPEQIATNARSARLARKISDSHLQDPRALVSSNETSIETPPVVRSRRRARRKVEGSRV